MISLILFCSITIIILILQHELLFRYGGIHCYFKNARVRLSTSSRLIAEFLKLEDEIEYIINASGVSYEPEVFKRMDIVFAKDLGKDVLGKASIYSKVFTIAIRHIIILDSYKLESYPIEKLIEVFIHEYKHHWCYYKYGDMDKNHQQKGIWKHE